MMPVCYSPPGLGTSRVKQTHYSLGPQDQPDLWPRSVITWLSCSLARFADLRMDSIKIRFSVKNKGTTSML